MQHRTERDFPVFAMISPVQAIPGTSVSLVVVSKDITERKHREAALRRLYAMIESSEDAIIGLDMQDLVTSWNTAAVEILGREAQEALGQGSRQLASSPPWETRRSVPVGVGNVVDIEHLRVHVRQTSNSPLSTFELRREPLTEHWLLESVTEE